MPTDQTQFPYIAEFIEGQTVTTFLYVQQKSEKTTKAQDPYLDLTLMDATGAISAKVWSDVLAETDKAQIDGAVKVQAKVGKYRDQMQLGIRKIRQVNESDKQDGFDEKRLFEATQYDREDMFGQLTGFLERVSDEPLRQMMTVLLRDIKETMITHPAAKYLHHPYIGGLVEHTLSVVNTSIYFADKYGLDLDITICGAILHDIGKIAELSSDPSREYTRKGRLVGHVVMGRDLLLKHSSGVEGLNSDTVLHLEHIILSHQGEKEWASPVVPQTPEAMAIHFADNADAKMDMFRRTVLNGSQQDSEFQRHNMLARYIFTKGPTEFKGKYPFF